MVAGVTAQTLRYLDILLIAPWPLTLTRDGGFSVAGPARSSSRTWRRISSRRCSSCQGIARFCSKSRSVCYPVATRRAASGAEWWGLYRPAGASDQRCGRRRSARRETDHRVQALREGASRARAGVERDPGRTVGDRGVFGAAVPTLLGGHRWARCYASGNESAIRLKSEAFGDTFGAYVRHGAWPRGRRGAAVDS
jgi:hypothetical protein